MRLPTLPSPATMTWPLSGRSLPRTDPVSRAPTTAAVTTGRNAIPSKVSMNWATFSGALSRELVTAAPAASRKVRYSALAGE